MEKKEDLRKLLLEAIQRDKEIDDDELIKDEDRQKKVVIKDDSKPRRSCANCTCGKATKAVVKESACGNCYKGDLFRCEGCPSFGLPPYKPGDEVTFNGDDDL